MRALGRPHHIIRLKILNTNSTSRLRLFNIFQIIEDGLSSAVIHFLEPLLSLVNILEVVTVWTLHVSSYFAPVRRHFQQLLFFGLFLSSHHTHGFILFATIENKQDPGQDKQQDEK